MRTLYLTSGHQIINGRGNGAHGVNGFDEAKEARVFTNILIDELKKRGIKAKTDDDRLSLSRVINWLSKNMSADCVNIDVHFNAAASPKATGAEVFVANNAGWFERKVGSDLSELMAKTLRIRNRGLKFESQSFRKRLGILSGASAFGHNILLEICFITNPGDVNAYFTYRERLAKEMANYLDFVLRSI